MDTTGDDPNDFIAQFHNLSGDSIAERKRNFYKLMKNPALFSDVEQVNNAIKGLQPQTYLEELFRLDLLIYLKRTAELTEILKEGNEVFISKILKQSWYFQEAFNDIDAQKLTNEILPCTSYAIRMKLLKRISNCWNEEKMDILFDELCERYGLHVAVPIFHTCSRLKIEEVLKDNDINLRPNQVKYLIDRDPFLFKLYVEQLRRERVNYCYDDTKVLYHLALRNPTLLLELEKEDKVTFCDMGRRTSKRIFDLIKEDLRKDIERYTRLLKKNVIVRKLGNEFKVVYLKLFPKKMCSVDMRNLCNVLLTLYPKNKRWDLFAQTFSQVFPNNSIDEALSEFQVSFFKLNPSRVIIEKWADIKYNQDKKYGDKFLKYLEPAKAISLLKEKINVTSDINNRTAAVMLLIETCGENKDLKTLEEVLKYICIRHRNEDSYFRTQFYYTVGSSFKLEHLNENHWKCINEQIKIDRLKKELPFWIVRSLIGRHLEFLFKNGKDHKTAIIELINDTIESHSDFELKLDNPPVEKNILIAICQHLPEVIKIDSDNYQRAYKNILMDVIHFSLAQPNFFINLTEFPHLVSFINIRLNKTTEFQEEKAFIESLLNYITFHKNEIPVKNVNILQLLTLSTEETRSFPNTAVKMFTKRERSPFENEVLNLYFEKLIDICPRKDVIHWFLRNEPRTLLPYFQKVLLNSLKSAGLFDSQQLRLFSHLDYDRKVCELYKAQLVEECDEKVSIMKTLIKLLPTTDFIKVVDDNFKPKKDKLDLEDEEMQKMYKVQCEVCKILHKVQEPSKIIPLVMKFCVGDYLQSALPSLYGVFYKSPEKLLYPYIDELSKRDAVSVKKHAIFLSCEVLDRKTVLNLLKNTKQTNVSTQKHQFSATLKYFLKSPSQELLVQVMNSMLGIDKNDTETLEKLKDIKVPRKYKHMYIENCWNFFEELAKSGVKVNEYLEGLLRCIDDDVLKTFSNEFVIDVISKYLPLQEERRLKGIEEFTIRVLENCELEQSDNFDVVFKMLSIMKGKRVKSFFDVFIKNLKYKNKACVDIFEKYWNEYFSLTDFIEEHISLKLLNIYLNCIGNPKLYAEQIVACLGQFVSEFGLHVFTIFKDKLTYFLSYHDEIEDQYVIFHNILTHKLTPNTCILVLQIMEPVSDDSLKSFEIFETIIRLLDTVQDTIVQAYYKKYLIDNNVDLK